MSAVEANGAHTEGDEPAGTVNKADTAAWLAVAAGTIGALMATLDISITNAALPPSRVRSARAARKAPGFRRPISWRRSS